MLCEYIYHLVNGDYPLYLNIVICIVASLSCFFVSVLAKNYSQVDKIWSIMPIVYTWVFTWYTPFNPRCILLSVLITIWGIRLSYNFHRKGGYDGVLRGRPWQGEEDYRWSILEKRINNRFLWVVFNFSFISFIQNIIIFVIVLPVSVCQHFNTPLGWMDMAVAGLEVLVIALETIADQ